MECWFPNTPSSVQPTTPSPLCLSRFVGQQWTERGDHGDQARVNQILDAVVTPLINEIAAKYDPTVRTTPTLGPLGDYLEFQALPAWREEAWRNAERLATAPDAAARAAVGASIDQAAAQEATALIALTRYLPPVTTSAARDAYCAAHVS